MKSTWFSDPDRREFAKLLHDADYSQRLGEVFSTFLECSVCCLRQAVHKFVHGCDSLDQKIEDDFAKAIARVKKPDRISHAFGAMTIALERRRYDFLGAVSGEMGMNDAKYRGQCFTPDDLARTIARLTIGDLMPAAGRTLMIDEPACGAGAMIIATAEELFANGFSPWHFCFRGTDVSRRGFLMTYIQTTLLSIPCLCFCANSLSLQVYDSAANLISVIHPPRRDPEAPAGKPKPAPLVQATMFGD